MLFDCHEKTTTFETVNITAKNNCLDQKMSHLKLEKLLDIPKNVLQLQQKAQC